MEYIETKQCEEATVPREFSVSRPKNLSPEERVMEAVLNTLAAKFPGYFFAAEDNPLDDPPQITVIAFRDAPGEKDEVARTFGRDICEARKKMAETLQAILNTK